MGSEAFRREISDKEIAYRLGTPRQIVSKWRKRFHSMGLLGLQDEPRGGRPESFPPGSGY
ncbi:MAG: helix-turn-helix domain-containing protein [Bacillota bacterium]